MTLLSTRGWRVHWFHKWEGVLDDALKRLPEHPQWPSSLLRVMFEAPSSVPKKVALLLDRSDPTALVGLRFRGRSRWEPLSTYIVPGFLIVGKQELTASVLAKLSTNLRVAWWRMPVEPPVPALWQVRSCRKMPTHILPLDEDPEVYWRQSHFLDTARKARRKSAHFQFVVNPPGGLQWVMCNSDEKWRRDPSCPAVDLGDRLAVDQFLQARGQHFTLALLDGDQPIAAEACIADRGDLVSVVCYMRPEYRSQMVGHAVLRHVIDWAKQSGFRGFDIGGGDFAYKSRFAPARGEKTEFVICPELQYRFAELMNYGEAVRNALDKNLARKSFQWLQRGIRNRLPGWTGHSS